MSTASNRITNDATGGLLDVVGGALAIRPLARSGPAAVEAWQGGGVPPPPSPPPSGWLPEDA